MTFLLAKSGIFLPSFHVPDFSLFLQNREMRVQSYGIFVSISDFSLFSSGGRENVSFPNVFVGNFKEGLSGMPLAHSRSIFGIRLGTCTERP